MKRFVIMTIGKTHSGKSTFAKLLEANIANSIIIDQDHQAAFLQEHYEKLVPKSGHNILKIGLSQFILQYAIQHTDFHIIISSANVNKEDRFKLLQQYFPKEAFVRIFIYFHINDDILQNRIQTTTRSTTIFRDSTMTFEQLLKQQENQVTPPSNDEADYIFKMGEQTTTQQLLKQIQQVIELELRK